MSQRDVRACELPSTALLTRYADAPASAGAAYTDCFCISIASAPDMDTFVTAFYSTWLFKMERWLLARAGYQSSADDLSALAARRGTRFAAWTVEARSANQVLLRDASGHTRSWLMRAPGASQTTLLFGSAVIGARSADGSGARLPLAYRVLLPVHRLYSRALLALAARRL